MAPRKSQTEFYVAKISFFAEVDGEQVAVTAGERARAGSAVLEACREYFEPVDTTVHYDVEQATAAPGEKRER